MTHDEWLIRRREPGPWPDEARAVEALGAVAARAASAAPSARDRP